jgi:hypothetical protein
VAARLGERLDSFELFGPATVGVWRASLAVEAGNAREALASASAVELRELASGNCRAALRLEAASGPERPDAHCAGAGRTCPGPTNRRAGQMKG